MNVLVVHKNMEITHMSADEIHRFIDDHLGLRSSEKDEFGEVFTPRELIDELLDHLPPSVYQNPNLKWLDPAAGRGNFSALVYCRLLKGLQSKIPNLEKRKTHIMENMLYMVELNPSNFKFLRRFFGPLSKISHSNFLTEKEKWTTHFGGTARFDIILGNPPFQTEKTDKYEGSSGHRTLWDTFLTTCLDSEILNIHGYLAFITPAAWRRPETPLYTLVTQDNQLIFLHIYGKSAGIEKFGVQTRFDSYVVKHSPSSSSKDEKSDCTIIDEVGEVYKNIRPRTWPFLPNSMFPEIKKILKKDPKQGIPVIFSSGDYDARKLSKRQTSKSRFPVVHGITQKGLGLRYTTKRKSSQFGVPKVILNFNERQYPYNDYDGKYGMSQLSFGIPIKSRSEGERWIRAINSPVFQNIIKATKWGAFQTDYRMFHYFDPKLYKRPEFT
jgi:hypothetical protein